MASLLSNEIIVDGICFRIQSLAAFDYACDIDQEVNVLKFLITELGTGYFTCIFVPFSPSSTNSGC